MERIEDYGVCFLRKTCVRGNWVFMKPNAVRKKIRQAVRE